MTKEETREYEQTQLRVKYNNSWPSSKWISPLQNDLLKRINDAGVDQVFYPLVFKEDEAVKILYEDARLNRLVSTILDVYDELPLRPDAAFDIAWRAFEIAMVFYLQEYYPQSLIGANVYTPVSIEHKISCIVNSVFESQLNHCSALMDVFKRLISDDISESVLHYIVARMFLPGQLQIKTQVEQVQARCRDILGAGLYEEYKRKYVNEDILNACNHRNAVRLLMIILRGENKIKLEHEYETLSFQKRITFVLSGILYSSRCERFHGDFFSPLKSDRSTLKTYYGQYWLLTVSYMFFWMTVHKYLEKKGVIPFFSLNDLADCIQKTIDVASGVMIK